VLAAALALPGCVITAQRVDVAPMPLNEGQVIVNPVKAHLKDGSTVVFPRGLSISGGSLRGAGTRFDLSLSRSTPVTEVPLDTVAALESFRNAAKTGETVAVTLLATAAGALLAAGLAVAIFGSCPTVYSHDGEGALLEAETFSHSIARLLESRDLDRLRATADPAGAVRLEVRNEALETHYINHLQLVEVVHAAGDWPCRTRTADPPWSRTFARSRPPGTAVVETSPRWSPPPTGIPRRPTRRGSTPRSRESSRTGSTSRCPARCRPSRCWCCG
jgi:hypothetical protein